MNVPICDGELQITYEQCRPYGIRDKGGFLFFFVDIIKFPGQEQRYRQEIERQVKLADYLLCALQKANDC